MRFSILVFLFFINSCAYMSMLKVKKNETRKLKGKLKYEFVDTMGSFIKSRHQGLNSDDHVVVKSKIFLG